MAGESARPDDARESRWAAEVVPQLVVGEAVWLSTAQRPRVLAIYAPPAGPAKGAVVVVHGSGMHPDWSLIGDLRSALTDRGFATLSVQMPVLAADAPRADYAALFPFAAERLDAAVAWLREHGHARVAVVSHSMGAAMVEAWLARTQHRSVDAWVAVGMLVGFAASPQRLPVLDLVAERDFPEVLALAPRRAAQLPRDACSRAVTLADTDHFLAGAVPRAVELIVPFLDKALAGGC
jgi:pimeloyl-ACP methyl ester carboxylesterase